MKYIMTMWSDDTYYINSEQYNKILMMRKQGIKTFTLENGKGGMKNISNIKDISPAKESKTLELPQLPDSKRKENLKHLEKLRGKWGICGTERIKYKKTGEKQGNSADFEKKRNRNQFIYDYLVEKYRDVKGTDGCREYNKLSEEEREELFNTLTKNK